MDHNQLNASCRVALAALIHDLGKFAQRADIPYTENQKKTHLQLYSRFHKNGGWFSHQHAAYTALAFDVIEQNAPNLIQGDMTPFASRSSDNWNITDSLVNAAAMHHTPQTLLQWIIATADRIASGFERESFENYNITKESKNYLKTRILTLFEQITLSKKPKNSSSNSLVYRYPLEPLSAQSIFPQKMETCEPTTDNEAKKQYHKLWDAFVAGLKAIPTSHRTSWPLWLDHFDTIWLTYTHAIPSATAFGIRPEVSLYDHSKTTAALAVALWRWHHAMSRENTDAIKQLSTRTDWNEKKFLLIQGDFFGIQDFIFAEGSQTNRQAAKLLRGRSLYVSLLMECAALKILETLNLPSTSQIINAAGKCLIVAENTAETIAKLKAVQSELNQWFLNNTYGIAGIGLAWKTASSNDFIGDANFTTLMKQLFEELENAKLQRFDLCTQHSAVLPMESFKSPCAWHGHLPADEKTEPHSAAITRDQILMGKQLVTNKRLLILNNDENLYNEKGHTQKCELKIFGYSIAFTEDTEITGKFAPLVKQNALRRCWDFALPENSEEILWHGYARRNINGYVPYINDQDKDECNLGRYQNINDKDNKELDIGTIKTFNHIACEDRQLAKNGKWIGQVALSTLKGDVDNLGRIFREGLKNTTFAKVSSLSRQMNAFFAIYLPCLCKNKYPDTYTVFAGGDDFFLIGPWYKTQQLASEMSFAFKTYVANNPDIHFSVGIIITKPGYPIHALAEAAEEALGTAKQYEGKNAINLFSRTVPWHKWQLLAEAENQLADLKERYKLSTGYLYSLFSLLEMAEKEKTDIQASLWRSRLAYRTACALPDNKIGIAEIAKNIGENGIANLKGDYRIPLSNYFYRQR